LILDPDDKNLAAKVKSDLATSVKTEFGIDLDVSHGSTGSDEISSNRTDAFFLCRSLLIREKIANYAEQFEGLYAMLRGLAVAFGIGAVYLAGWGCSPSVPHCLIGGALVIAVTGSIGVLASSLLAAKRGPFHPKKASADLWLLGFILIAVFGLGLSFGVAKAVKVNNLPALWISTLVAFVASTRCYSGYRAFAMRFAEVVWRDFLSFKSRPSAPSMEGSVNSPRT
jgi:hypothetical protein